MIGPLTGRRANRFARAVDADNHAEQQQPAVDDAMRSLVAVVDRLRTTDFDGAPTPEFTARLRERLVAAAATAPTDVLPRVEAPGAAPRRAAGRPARAAGVPLLARLGSPRIAVLAGALSALVALAGVTVVASDRALPGDRLYSLKRTTEHVELVLARGDEAKARRHLDFAQNRAGELADFVTRKAPSTRSERATARLDDGDIRLVRSALSDMDSETRVGARLLTTYAVGKRLDAPLADLAAWAADQRAILQPALDRLTGDAEVRAKQSAALIDQVRQRVAALRAQLTCSCLGRVRGDDLGPLPCLPCRAAVPPAGQASTNPSQQQTGGRGSTPGTSSGTGAGPGAPQPTPSAGQGGGSAGPSPSAPPPSGSLLPTLPSESGSPSDGGLLPPLLPSGLPSLLPTVPDLLPGVFGN